MSPEVLKSCICHFALCIEVVLQNRCCAKSPKALFHLHSIPELLSNDCLGNLD